MLDEAHFEVVRLLEGVRLDAPDKVGRLRLEALDESADGHLELRGGGGRPLERRPARVALGEQLLHDRMPALEHGLRQSPHEQVVVLVEEPGRAVRHPAGVVLDPAFAHQSKRTGLGNTSQRVTRRWPSFGRESGLFR